ncbi:DgyrCDS1170 [Dimorphilus gyrociliatus]|uniref:DgyrCDS1170 n=1 Tax=Dimorphilus gyrociliatus TaxID=2664684 RepID=A0A7I8V8J6_9ANNE|nr:DgyrCDS1170 [Dimorphilus gyrociliatus]
MIVFPEGTRYNPSQKQVMEKSRKYAKEQGLPELDYVLSPRYKAVQQCLKSLDSTVMYNVTIAYEGSVDENGKRKQAPGLIDFLNGRCKEVHIHMERIETKNIPKDDAGLGEWLHDRFMQKDKMLQRYYTVDGALSDGGIVNTLQLRETIPSFLFFLSMAVPLIVTATGRALYLKASLGSAVFSWIWMAITT